MIVDIQNLVHQLRRGIILMVSILVTGTLGYMYLENWGLLDSLYMTVISITTTGFAEINPISPPGRIFTIFLIITGVLSIAYTGGRTAQFFIETEFFKGRRMLKKVENLTGHYIVCGYGRMGKTICDGLIESNSPFLVIENSEAKIEILDSRNILYVFGDATSDETLIKAGIERAKGFVCVIRTDAENVFASLSAKELNPEVYIVARAIDEGTEAKLRKAGADRVVKPYDLGGNRMVQLLLRPGVIDFIDGVARDRDLQIGLEEIQVCKESKLVGKTLMDSPIRKELNIIVVAISRVKGEFIYNPGGKEIVSQGDKLIAIGEKSSLTKLAEYCHNE